MITIEKLEEYEKYHGYYDGFYMQKVKSNTNLNSDEDWFLISELIQDQNLVNKKLTSLEYENNHKARLEENCFNTEVIELLKEISLKDWN